MDKMDKNHGLDVCTAVASAIGMRLPKGALAYLIDHPDDYFVRVGHSEEWDGRTLVVCIGETPDRRNAVGEPWKWVLQGRAGTTPRLTTNTA